MLTHTYTLRVEFGDCDPAQIVWFPNYFRWADAASRHFFIQCGLPSWKVSEETRGIIGTPLVAHGVIRYPLRGYGDTLQLHTRVAEWREKSFVQRYRVMRGDDLIMECDEVRIFATRREDGKGIRALPIPTDIKTLCS